MNDSKNITILVNSCDLYEDAWDPFFKLLKIQWPECEEYDIVLNTETKTFDCSYLNVRSVCGGKGIPWAKRLKNCLNQIGTPFVLYFLEDFFLISKVDNDSFLAAKELMENDPEIGYIGLKFTKERRFKKPETAGSKEPFYNKDDVITVNRVNSMTALWKKSWLESLIRVHETPWEFEIYGSIRSRRTPEKVMIINNSVLAPVFDYGVDLQYGYGISMKKWLPRNRELFEKYGIEVNYDKLGEMSWETLNKFVSGSSDSSQKDNRTTVGIREKLYSYKKAIKKIPKRIKKRYRIIKSLI